MGVPSNLPRFHEVPGQDGNSKTLVKEIEVSFPFIPSVLYRFWFSASGFVSSLEGNSPTTCGSVALYGFKEKSYENHENSTFLQDT